MKRVTPTAFSYQISQSKLLPLCDTRELSCDHFAMVEFLFASFIIVEIS